MSAAIGQGKVRDSDLHGRLLECTPVLRAVHSAPSPGERFAAYVAHELRTPLTTQRALLELALADPNANVLTWREVGESVLRGCLQQERLLEACLTLSRSRFGPRRCEPVDLAAAAAGALRAQDLVGLTGVVALEPAWAGGDPGLIERLVANLVSNAIRHNIPGGRIEVATRSEPGRAVLSVANTGAVIPARELQGIFQPFRRLALDPPDPAEGVGLGLAIVQAVADAHGARVTARRRAGGGLAIEVGFSATAAIRPHDPSEGRGSGRIRLGTAAEALVGR